VRERTACRPPGHACVDSPLPILLKRAKQFVGKRYADVVRAIPAELLAEWERSEVGS
jgi:hypothetical protein